MTKEQLLKKIGKNIKIIRKKKGVSQAELARRCFKDPQSIEKVENGKVNPTIFYLHEVVQGIGLNIKDIL